MIRDVGTALCLMLQLCYQGNTFPDTNCPSHCQCFTATTVICSDERKTVLPKNVSEQVKEMIIMTTGLAKVGSNILHDSPQLTKLVLLNNLLRDVSATAFDHLAGLEELEISGNPWLEHLHPGTFRKQASLTRLLLNFNRLKSLSPGLFDSLQKLRTLQLKSNAIRHLPGLLFQNLHSLRSLDLSLNMLTGVDGKLLTGLTQLETLRLGHNLITALPSDAFHNISQVRKLSLEGNQITELPRGVFSHLNKLEDLNLRGNLITNVSCGTFPSSLRELDLKGNRLMELSSDLLGRLTALTHLFLSMNQLSELPEDVFWNLTALQNLDLSENHLTILPEKIFYNLSQIKMIHLQKNNLSSLEAKLFEDQSLLEQLYLSENNLQTLPHGLFDSFLTQNIVRLHGNPWKCDCHMQYLYDWVVENSVEDFGKVFCMGPGSLRGQGLVSVERDQLVCRYSSEALEEDRPHPSKCTLQAVNNTMIIKCKVTKCSPFKVNVQFHERDGSLSEYIVKKEWPEFSQCINGTITLTV